MTWNNNNMAAAVPNQSEVAKASALAALISARLKSSEDDGTTESSIQDRRLRALDFQKRKLKEQDKVTRSTAGWKLDEEEDELLTEEPVLGTGQPYRKVLSIKDASSELRRKRAKTMRFVYLENDPLDDYLKRIEDEEPHFSKFGEESMISLDQIIEETEEKEDEPLGPEYAVQRLKEEEKRSKLALGRLFSDDGAAIDDNDQKRADRSALEVFAEQLRKKELQAIDHASIEYIPIRKNLFLVPKELAEYTERQLEADREGLEIKVRGKSCPPMIASWQQCGLPEVVLEYIKKQFGEASEPFPVQRQAIPALMTGRDVIAVAKTGSGKTLAFLLPALRHLLDQPPIVDGSQGPICLILAPARELALQIYRVAKALLAAAASQKRSLRCGVIYGGGRVADQIAELKRGADLIVATPGRLIDILTMQQGRMVKLTRVSYIVLDEADRMFDMGFEPQITQILRNSRPDRQTALFSATFPKAIEQLARKSLAFPLEIVCGGRSVAASHIEQFVEIRKENTKFMRLLQLLGIWVDRGSVLVFVDTQAKCDSIFQDLIKAGYPCLALHGGMDQADRASTVADFNTQSANVLIATSVAGRGLDLPSIRCVINYSAPNHLEDYVHRVGRTGRAGHAGTAYTFIDPTKEEAYAPILFKALTQAKQIVPRELAELAESFRTRANAGEAKWAKSGFVGNRGYKFNDDELTPSQRIEKAQKKQFEIDIGLHDETKFEEDLEIENNEDVSDQEGINNEGINNESQSDIHSTTQSQSATSSVLANALAEASEASTAAQKALSALSASKDLTPLERAKLLAAHFGRPGTVPISNKTAAPQAQEALARARALAASLGGSPATTIQGPLPDLRHPTNPNHFYDEIDINDYPSDARARATQRDSISRVTEDTGAAIISRGVFLPPGKALPLGERRLHLAIEASSLYALKSAKSELLRMLNEETLNSVASGRISSSSLKGSSNSKAAALPLLGSSSSGPSVFGKYSLI